MYTLLICDDEYYIRESLASRIRDFDFPAISKILTAYDVESALAVSENNSPDIVITDIRMEKDNGFDLIKKMKERYSNVQYIVVSGYDEFRYAKNAIEMEVTGYLLKPIIDEELCTVIETCIKKLYQNREAMSICKSVQAYEQKKLNLQREQEIISLLQNGDLEDGVTRKLFGWGEGMYSCAMFYIAPQSFCKSTFQSGEEELLKFGIKNIVDEIAEKFDVLHYSFVMTYKVNCLPLIIYQGIGEKDPRIEEFLEVMSRQMLLCFGVKVYLSVSSPYGYLNKNMLTESMFAVKYRFFNLKEFPSVQRFHFSPVDSDALVIKTEALRKTVKMQSCEGIKNAVEDILNDSSENISSFEKICGIIGVVMETAVARKNFLSVLDELVKVNDDVFETMEELKDYFADILIELSIECPGGQLVQQKNRETVYDIEAFINRNYMNKISVQELAKMFYIEPSYLSTLFKKHTGVKLTNYIRDLRIEKACVLLRETDMKTTEIATQIGFDDLLYFYKIFKKLKGVTTTQYREQCKDSSLLQDT